MVSESWKTYLIWFAQEHLPFRHAELQSLVEMFQVEMEVIDRKLDGRRLWMVSEGDSPDDVPWLTVKCKEEEKLRRICSRSILIRNVTEIYGMGRSLDEVVVKLQQSQVVQTSHRSYKFNVETFGHRLSREEQLSKMEMLDFLPLNGPISMTDPDDVYNIIEYYGSPSSVRTHVLNAFFGRLVAEGQRKLVQQLSLKTRSFIANTSMDPTLSIVMSNMAKTQSNDLVFDPFVGSASLLVAAALHGAYVFGTDIDYMLLHGRAKPSRCNETKRKDGEGVEANLRQYKLENRYIDVIVGDSSLPVLRTMNVDAIITDPPYGIRESTERIGQKKSNYPGPGHLSGSHIPSKVSYTLQDVLGDLLRFAATNLEVGRRLVFWMPVIREDFLQDLETKTAFPTHPCLTLVACSEQRLASHTSRMLCTYEKTKEIEEDDHRKASTVTLHNETFRDKYFKPREEPS